MMISEAASPESQPGGWRLNGEPDAHAFDQVQEVAVGLRSAARLAPLGGRGFYPRNGDLSDFPTRYDAPGSIAGPGRGVRITVIPEPNGPSNLTASAPGISDG